MELIDRDVLFNSFNDCSCECGVCRYSLDGLPCGLIENAPPVEAIPKANVYKAIQEMMKYEHEGFINISLARLDDILKKCGVKGDGKID